MSTSTPKFVLKFNSQEDLESLLYGFCCVYCGNTTDITRDHVIPVSWESEKRSYKKGDTIKSCRECNSHLGDKLIFSVPDRAAYLLSTYSKKYSKLLKTEDYTDEELSEMDFNLKSMIRSNMNQKEFVKTRMQNLSIISCCVSNKFEVKSVSEQDSKAYQVYKFLFSGMSKVEIGVILKIKTSSITMFAKSNKFLRIRTKFLIDVGLPLETNLIKLNTIVKKSL